MYKSAEIKGGLLFEKDIDVPVIINPNYLVYKRKLDLKEVMRAVDITEEFTKVYKSFCDSIQDTLDTATNVRVYNYRHYFYIPSGIHDLTAAKSECDKVGTTLPEIRTPKELKDLIAFATENNISDVNIAIKFITKEKRVVYESDSQPLTQTLQYMLIPSPPGYPSSTGWSRVHIYDELALPQWRKGTQAYLHITNGEGLIKNFLTVGGGPRCQIVCKKKHAPTVERDNTFLLDLAAHMCARDYNNIKGMTDVVTKEAALFKVKGDTESTSPLPDNPECPKGEAFDKNAVAILVNEIRRRGRLVATKTNYPIDVAQKYLLFRALALQTQEEFRKFLAQDFRKSYYSINPTQSLIHKIACDLDTENTTPTQTLNQNYDRFFTTDVDDLMETIHRLTNIVTSPLSIIRHKRASDISSLTNPILPDSIKLFSTSNVGYLLGIATVEDVKRSYEYIVKNAIDIGDLHINQLELKQGYDNLAGEIRSLQQVKKQMDIAVASISAVLDNKATVTQLHNTIRQSLLIIANAVTAAHVGKLSPYILSEQELDKLAADLRVKNLYLTGKIDDIHTRMYNDNDEFIFILSIPIVDQKFIFHLLNVRPFPVFTPANESQIVVPDIKYLAVSLDALAYMSLTEMEYSKCIKQSFCRVTGPRRSINKAAHCVVRSYRSKTQNCPFSDAPDAKPFFATYGNRTLFSTPANLEGNLVCPTREIRTGEEAVTGKITFNGVGSIFLKPQCFVELPSGDIISAQYETNIATDLGISTMNEAFQYLPNLEHYEFKEKYVDVFENHVIPDLDLKPIEQNSIAYITEMAVSHDEVIKHLIRFAIMLAVAAFIFAVLYCTVPKFRRWVKACCFLKPPTKFWSSQGYEMPPFIFKNNILRPKFSPTSNDPDQKPISKMMNRIMRRQNALHAQRTDNSQLSRPVSRDLTRVLNENRAEYMDAVTQPFVFSGPNTSVIPNASSPAYEPQVPRSDPPRYLPATSAPTHVSFKLKDDNMH